VLAAQLTHAAGESSPGGLPSGTRAVVLAVDDEPQLVRVEERLRVADLAHVAIREPDAPWAGALMAIGIVPLRERAAVRRVLGRMALL
jgi:hypothetical protein